jgi:hypothetical protein
MTLRRSRGYRGLLASVFDLPWLVAGCSQRRPVADILGT